MFEKLMLRTVKQGDILIAYPKYKEKVKVIIIFDSNKSQINWLRTYWNDNYDVELPISFKIAVCQFATTPYKNYNYPLLTECVIKPIRQRGLRLTWKLVRQQFLLRKGHGKVSIREILGVNQEALSKAKDVSQYLKDINDERGDNKGNWGL